MEPTRGFEPRTPSLREPTDPFKSGPPAYRAKAGPLERPAGSPYFLFGAFLAPRVGSVLNGVQSPFAGDTFEFVGASVRECDSGAGDKVLDRR